MLARKFKVDFNTIAAIAILIFLLFNFGPRGLDVNDAADISREVLYRHPGLSGVEGKVFIDILDITDKQTHWRVDTQVVCKPSLERAQMCAPSDLRDKGILLNYVVYVHKATGKTSIVEPAVSHIAR